MYNIHPSHQLNEIFRAKPYQGTAPEDAKFLFIGLDANYDPAIETSPVFPKILEYHENGVTFWQKYGVHHPFLLSDYKGDGKFYHKSFADIGFKHEHAELISFVELLHLPTVGRNKLEATDLDKEHLKKINHAILEGKAEYIFISAKVAFLMHKTRSFTWLNKKVIEKDDTLGIYNYLGKKKIYSHLHFSNYGKFLEQKRNEALFIRGLVK